MRLNPVAVANSIVLTAALFYVICWLFAHAAPGICQWAFQGWFHWLDPSPEFKPEDPAHGPTRVFTGLLMLAVGLWIASWLFATMYNQLSAPRRRDDEAHPRSA